jgi:uncharacterized protein (DUF305 family)
MKTKKLGIPLGILLAFPLLASSALAAEPAIEHTADAKDPMVQVVSKKTDEEFEPTFLAMMIHHHHGGMKMAKLVDSHGDNSELKKMAAEMIATQGKEISQMTDWLKQWHSKSPEEYKVPEATEQTMAKTMAKLEAAKGKEFDHHFAKEMAAHHESGIAMAHLAQGRTEHQEVKSLAGTIVKMQTDERTKLLKYAGQE